MKRIIISIICACSFTTINVQAQSVSTTNDEVVEAIDNEFEEYYEQNLESDEKDTSPDSLAEFPGGINALLNYLISQLHYPQSCQVSRIQGRVLVRFVVTKDGSIGDVDVMRGVHPDLDREAVRVVKSFPRFSPALRDGRAVNSYFMLPINFKL